MSAYRRKRRGGAQKLRGPSRPIDPRYAPGPAVRRGPDSFAIGLIGVSTAFVLLIVLFIAIRPTTPSVTPSSPSNPAAGGSDATQAAIAQATQQIISFATQSASLDRISAADAIAQHSAGTAQFIDVRPAEQYNASHIKGSTNIPYTEARNRISDFPKTGTVILYCQ